MPYKFSTNILFLSNLHPTNKVTGMNFSLLKKRQTSQNKRNNPLLLQLSWQIIKSKILNY